MAFFATALSASSEKVSFDALHLEQRWYCLTSAFFGSVRI
jgi:hypothetical protein